MQYYLKNLLQLERFWQNVLGRIYGSVSDRWSAFWLLRQRQRSLSQRKCVCIRPNPGNKRLKECKRRKGYDKLLAYNSLEKLNQRPEVQLQTSDSVSWSVESASSPHLEELKQFQYGCRRLCRALCWMKEIELQMECTEEEVLNKLMENYMKM